LAATPDRACADEQVKEKRLRRLPVGNELVGKESR
jgi:hypothetical protein